MDNTFELKAGKLVFEEDKIVISDKAKSLKYSRLFSIAIFLLFSIFYLVDYVRHDKIHSLWTCLIFGIAGIVMLVSFYLMDAQGEIYLKDVKSMKIKRLLFKEFLAIKLKNGRTRQVAGIYNTERLEEYIKTISLSK
jgi:hypothetical protein